MDTNRSGAEPSGRSRQGIVWAGAVIAAAAVAAYHNSLAAQFNFDDGPAIVDNSTIRHLWDLGAVLSPPPGGATVSGRPVLNLSFAVNYAISGRAVWSYHVLNLLIHILAGLTLFGIVRRTLGFNRGMGCQPMISIKHGLAAHATFISFAVALIWTVHPLQTEAVTYVVQRAESLMGLFYLLTLYGFIRYADESEGERRKAEGGKAKVEGGSMFSPSAFRFPLFSISACLLGMGTKEVMVSAPVIVLLYDRTFVAGSFREAWRLRKKYYAGLAATWILLLCLALGTGTRGGTAGVNTGVDPVSYWLTQFPAVVHYLVLAFWPTPLVLDYGMQLAPSAATVVPSLLVVAGLAAGSVWLLTAKTRNLRAAGFAGAVFFAILAPTCLVPVVSQVVAEHRMYLALAPVVTVAVVGGYLLLARAWEKAGKSGAPLRSYLVLCLAVAAGLGFATARRNEDYRTSLSLWTRTAEEVPLNPRAQYNLGQVLDQQGDRPAAMEHYRAALRLKPDYFEAHTNLGIALADAGRWPEAIAEYEQAVRLGPGFAQTHYNLGNAFLHLGNLTEAIACYEEARDLAPDDPNVYFNLGVALTKAGRVAEAIPAYEEAVRLRPDSLQAQIDLAYALTHFDRLPEALPHFQVAARLEPDNPEIRNNLGCALAQLGRTAEARVEFEAALRLAPNDAEVRANLAHLPGTP